MPQETVSATSLVGVWRLIGSAMSDSTGKVLDAPYGPRGMGTVSLTADGRMMAMLIDGRAAMPDGVRRNFVAYCGNYTFDGATLVTTVDASSIPQWIGSKQMRKARFDRDRLILSLPDMERDGVTIRGELTFEKISPVSL